MSAGRLRRLNPLPRESATTLSVNTAQALPGLFLYVSFFPLIVIPPFFCLVVICLLAIKTIGVFYTFIYYLSSPYHLGFNSSHPSLLVLYLIIETSPPLLFFNNNRKTTFQHSICRLLASRSLSLIDWVHQLHGAL